MGGACKLPTRHFPQDWGTFIVILAQHRQLKNTYWRLSQSHDWHFQMPVTVWIYPTEQIQGHAQLPRRCNKEKDMLPCSDAAQWNIHARRRVGDLHSWRLSCQVDRPPATTEEIFIVRLIVWLLPFRGFTMEMKHKAKSSGNFPMLKSVRVHHWQQIWALKASLELGFSFTMHIDFWHCWVRHISTLTRQPTVKHTHALVLLSLWGHLLI